MKSSKDLDKEFKKRMKEAKPQKSFCVDCWQELKRREINEKTYEVFCPEHGVKYRCKDNAKGDL